MSEEIMTNVDEVVAREKLADTKPDCGAMKLSEQLSAKIDEATVHIVNELDQLKDQIEQIKARLIQDAAAVKDAVATHFMLGAEALAFRNKVATRLQELVK
jgi:hypothetical protein